MNFLYPPSPFVEHLREDRSVVRFPNLGGDALIVVPCRQDGAAAYAHIAAFVRSAPLETQAKVHLEIGDDGPAIPRIDLACEASVPGISDDEFHEHADAAKKGCPVSKVLAGAEISLDAKLK